METLIHWLEAGGFMMYPLLLCSFLAVAIAVERYRFFRAHQSDIPRLKQAVSEAFQKGDMNGLRTVLVQDGGSPANVLLQALPFYGTSADPSALLESAMAGETARLRARLPYLSVIVTLAPLMGLLGTVLGMIRSFQVLSSAAGRPFVVTGGVAEALVCTAAGLCVAILALLLHAWLAERLEHLTADMEQLSGLYLAAAEGSRS